MPPAKLLHLFGPEHSRLEFRAKEATIGWRMCIATWWRDCWR